MADGNNADKYFALKLGQDYLDSCRQFELNWKYVCEDTGLWHLWYLLYCASLGINPDNGDKNSTQQVRTSGPQQQYALFRIQLMRRIIAARIMLAKDERPSFNGVATNNDVESLAEVNVSSKAAEYMMRKAELEQRASECLESLGYFGGGSLGNSWDYNGGELVPAEEPEIDPETGDPLQMPKFDPQSGEPVMEPHPQTNEPVQAMQTVTKTVQKKSGAPKILKFYPWQTAVDPYIETDHMVVITKRPVNKYEYATKFPEKAQAIIAETIESDMGDDAIFAWGSPNAVSSDTVILREVFHANCEAVPGGRWSAYIGKIGLWGVDEMVPCPLDEGIPVKFMIGPRYWGTSFGYPEASDVLSLQSVLNEGMSQAITNLQKRGSSNAYKSDDVQIDPRSFSMGNNLIDVPAGRQDKAVVWDDPPELGSLLQFVVEFVTDQAEQMLGGNPTALGKPDANITSGAFGVLMVNVAQKYANQFQETHDNAITATANDSLELMRKNASNGFWAQIAGIGDQPYMELIKPDKMQTLKRVLLVRQSPVLSTFPGRVEVFDRLVKLPKPDRADASEMLLSGRMDAFTERDQAARLRIRKENEMMLKGIMPTVTAWDDHAIEGPIHRAEYDKVRTMDPPADPEKRAIWEQSCVTFDSHLQAHAMALASAAPPIAIVAGWQPMAAPAAEGQPSEAGGPAGGQAGAQQQPKPPQKPKAPQPPAGVNAPMGNP